MRAGKKWEGITILLIGAFSKYVNSLQEGEERTKDQISTLKMLRAWAFPVVWPCSCVSAADDWPHTPPLQV